jgi:hypothetical protein
MRKEPRALNARLADKVIYQIKESKRHGYWPYEKMHGVCLETSHTAGQLQSPFVGLRMLFQPVAIHNAASLCRHADLMCYHEFQLRGSLAVIDTHVKRLSWLSRGATSNCSATSRVDHQLIRIMLLGRRAHRRLS